MSGGATRGWKTETLVPAPVPIKSEVIEID